MLTARRIREQEARERAGLPPPPPPLPREISMQQHQQIVAELNKKHSAELKEARTSAPAAKPSKALEGRVQELTQELGKASARVLELEAANATLTQQLEQATAKPPDENQGGSKPKPRR